MIAALKPIAEPEAVEEGPKGLTAMVRTVLSRSQGPMSIKEIRKELERDGLDTSRYAQFPSTLKITINRMVENKQVRGYDHPDGELRYAWFLNAPEVTIGFLENAAEVNIAGHAPTVQIEKPAPSAVKKLIRDSEERRKKLLGK